MSDSVLVDGEAVVRHPRQREERETNAEVNQEFTLEEEAGGDEEQSEDPHDPVAALAESRKALQEREAENASLRTREQEARNQAARARDEAARANMGRATDRAAAVAASIEAAKADQTSARIALRAAREANDLDAEISASEMLQSASYRYNQANGELNWLNQQSQSQPQQAQQQNQGMSPEAKAWLDAHPRFHTDTAYRALAEGAHTAALRAGRREGSQEYVDFIDKMVENVYGQGHGQGNEPPVARKEPPVSETKQPSRTSAAGPTNRGNGSANTGGQNTVQTELGPLQVTTGRDGKTRIAIPQHTRADWDEAAQINGMKTADYAYEQIKIARERAQGGNAGWVKSNGDLS